MKIWIIAGESSGDTYGARISRELKKLVPNVEISGMGGEEMKQEGLDLMVDSTELGVMGIIEVAKLYPTFKKIFNMLVEEADKQRPDAVVLIDYPGFNLRYAEKLHELNIPVCYYVSPQVWAWHKKRIPKIARVVTKMMVIFPFEKDVYKDTDLDVEFVGHPLAEILNDTTTATEREKDTVLLLPGSRFSEIKRLLKPFVETADKIRLTKPNLKFVIPAPREKIRDHIKELLPKLTDCPGNFTVECGNTTQWMRRAAAGIAASGTVTVQAAILGLPLISCYRLNPLTYLMAMTLVKIPFFTMPNVIEGDVVYEEFLQGEVRPEVLSPALEKILPDGRRYQAVQKGMASVVEKLGGKKGTLKRAAECIIETVNNTKK
ncbi:MAG: lipid-A-disaccharide synthase [Lentisphaerales bacterium]|nr:lipid-A-disaccharide synthase [Lentisphaerales bacterium]